MRNFTYLPESLYLVERGENYRIVTLSQIGDKEKWTRYVKDTDHMEYVRSLEGLVSEAVDIFKEMLVQDDSGLVFISSVGGKTIDRAVAFVAAAKRDES